MPTSIADVFAAAGLTRQAVVRWGTRPSTSQSGVYVVALTSSVDDDAILSQPPLADDWFEAWLSRCAQLTLDGVQPTVNELKRRVKGFWLPDEIILYIGLASTLSSRLGAYYRTPIGARRPHSGGYFLKLLSNLDDLWVHYAPCADPGFAEDGMIDRFCAGVSHATKRMLIDPQHPFPFANLEWPRVSGRHMAFGALASHYSVCERNGATPLLWWLTGLGPSEPRDRAAPVRPPA
jgi:hypothetical protein